MTDGVREKEKGLALTGGAIAGIAIGVGLLTVGGYYWYKEYEKGKLIEDIKSELADMQEFYNTQIANKILDENKGRILVEMQGALDTKGKLAEEKGLVEQVGEMFRDAGIMGLELAAAIAGTYALIWFLRRRPPKSGGPTFKCPVENKEFVIEPELKAHIEAAHPIPEPLVNPAFDENLERAYQDFMKAPIWVQKLVSQYAPEWSWEDIKQNWREPVKRAAIASLIAVIVTLIAVSFGILTPSLGPVLVWLRAALVVA